jgi:hypothetical protein
VESLLGGVYCIVVLCLASGLGDACMLFGVVVERASVEGKQVARPGLARVVVVGQVRIREASKLEAVVRAPTQEAEVDVFHHSREGRGVHARDAG